MQQHLINNIRRELEDQYTYSELSTLVRIILEEVFSIGYTEINSDKINNLSPSMLNKVEDIVSRLKKNEPIQYILGKTEFYGLNFTITPNVLIPRPETEELVEWIITEISNEKSNILDIGTGSGCIAVTLAKKLPDSKVHAWDISKDALKVAMNNARLNNVTVNFSQQDVLALKVKQDVLGAEKFDIIVSNPPYVVESEKATMDENVLRYEPHKALFVPNDNPLLFYEKIINIALFLLKDNGELYFEINRSYGEQLSQILFNKRFKSIELRKDISGNFRMIKGVKKAKLSI